MSESNRKKATIQDVARLAAVSPGTVSHVLNGTAPISDETKTRVHQAIRALDYHRNENARALRTADSKMIGVVLQDISSEFYAHCTAGILQRAQEAGYAVFTVDAHFTPEVLKSGVAALVDRRANGLIFIGGWQDRECYESAVDAGVPVVFGDRWVEDHPCVQFNNRQTMRNLVHALYLQGFRHFSYVGEALGFQENLEQRYGGVYDGVRELGIEKTGFHPILDDRLRGGKLRHSFDYFMTHPEVFAGYGEPHVILTSNDLIAQGAIHAMERSGRKVPQDVAVVGFDNISAAAYGRPSITTVAQDAYRLGQECFSLLMKRLSGACESKVLTQQIAIRESAPLTEENAALAGLSIFREQTPDPERMTVGFPLLNGCRRSGRHVLDPDC